MTGMPSPPMPDGARIFHVVTADAWRTGSPQGPVVEREQFERHGFVHCCFREQLTEVATWWFEAGTELLALELDPTRLTREVRLEPSPSRWYPHVYGPLDTDALVDVHALPRSVDGVTDLPPQLGTPPPGYQLTGCVDGVARTATWRAGDLDADRTDPVWRERAESAIADGRTIELIGGIVVPATLAGAYESFVLLSGLTDDGGVARYDGDGFFVS